MAFLLQVFPVLSYFICEEENDMIHNLSIDPAEKQPHYGYFDNFYHGNGPSYKLPTVDLLRKNSVPPIAQEKYIGLI